MTKIIEMRGFQKVSQDYGLEIEMEVAGDRDMPDVKNWRLVGDGSLRGHSGEYVSTPMSAGGIISNLRNLQKSLDESGLSIRNSIRSGVHFHINMHNKTLEDVAKITCLYSIFERPILRFCGDNREYNHFCIPLNDTELPVEYLRNALKYEDVSHLGSDRIRYCALNLASLYKHGTIEFRCMETRPDLDGIEEFTTLIRDIVKKALSYGTMNDLLEEFSMYGGAKLAEETFGKNIKLLDKIDEEECIEGMRLAQDICYYKEL